MWKKLSLRHSGAGNIFHFPFEISVGGNANDGFFAKLRPGTINSLLPSNMFDLLDITEEGVFYIILDVSTDGDAVVDAVIGVQTDVPEGIGSEVEVAPEFFTILIGLVVNKKPFNIVHDLITVNPQLTIQTLKEDLVPGEPYYDNNYTWVML